MRNAWCVAGTVALLGSVVSGAAAQGRGFVQPTCDVPKGNYLINSATLYLKNAGITRYADQRQRDLRDANRVLLEAITEKGQDQNGSAWYYLGRYYQEMKDLGGADSAFTRAATLLPQCVADINENRRRLWVPILNGAVDRLKAGDNEGALEQLRTANSIYYVEPPAFYYMGQIFANLSQQDSAVAYFAKALEIARLPANLEKEQYADIRENAEFNIARLYHLHQQYDSAVAWYRRFRETKPNDPQALTGEATSLEAAGHTAEALAVYDRILTLADSMTPLDLFQTGVAMFRANQLRRAAEAFERGLEGNPYHRDALFNLANTYLSLAKDTAGVPAAKRDSVHLAIGRKMTPITARLVQADPYATSARRLQAAAFQLSGLPDSTLRVLEDLEKMSFEVTVSRFEPVSSGFDVRGVVTNLRSEATPVPALVFEFVDAQGAVVQSITVDGQTAEPDGVVPFALAPVGESIVAWRYHAQS